MDNLQNISKSSNNIGLFVEKILYDSIILYFIIQQFRIMNVSHEEHC